jgi:UDP-N-acetylglucosamine 2-epimerase (non-hydrolysing)
MIGFEKVCAERKPDWVVVFGDVNSTVACSLVAAKLGIRVAHVEAGLRSFDRTMPEEINRVVTDAVADLLFAPSQDAKENLAREGVPDARIRLVGNIMIDSLVANLAKAKQSAALNFFSVEPDSFVYVTLHRPANVDSRANLTAIADGLKKLSHQLPVVFPVHPRTRKMFSEFGLDLTGHNGFRLAEPIGYHDSIWLTQNARLVLTDSGGLQEEATYFQTPCLTLRPNTERPVTIEMGSNRLTSVSALSADLGHVLSQARRLGRIPPLWDGKTSPRIVEALSRV